LKSAFAELNVSTRPGPHVSGCKGSKRLRSIISRSRMSEIAIG
jgi:hypothetical protein